ncbi:MAG: enoyl-CoA hydratase-related protein [Anaerolineaceae bacterium]
MPDRSLVGAAEAKEAGLVSEVVAPDQLLNRAVEIGELIAAQPPEAVARVKAMFAQNATNSDVRAVMAIENAANAAARSGSEHKEAVAAFMEKRPARF